jgi:hypothetical protein
MCFRSTLAGLINRFDLIWFDLIWFGFCSNFDAHEPRKGLIVSFVAADVLFGPSLGGIYAKQQARKTSSSSSSSWGGGSFSSKTINLGQMTKTGSEQTEAHTLKRGVFSAGGLSSAPRGAQRIHPRPRAYLPHGRGGACLADCPFPHAQRRLGGVQPLGEVVAGALPPR